MHCHHFKCGSIFPSALIAFMVSLMILALPYLCFMGQHGVAQAAQTKKGTKIRITSDEMEALDQQGSVVFKGNVVTKRGDVTIYSDRLEVYYEQEGKASEGGDGGESAKKGKKLKRIVAKGHVKVIQGKRKAVAETATYDKRSEVIVLRGGAQVWDGPNTIKGSVIRFYLNEDRSVVEGGKSRVEAVVFSDE